MTKTNMGEKNQMSIFFLQVKAGLLWHRQWLANKSLRDGLFHLGKVKNLATKLEAVSAFCGRRKCMSLAAE
jgi:hypothetical protein